MRPKTDAAPAPTTRHVGLLQQIKRRLFHHANGVATGVDKPASAGPLRHRGSLNSNNSVGILASKEMDAPPPMKNKPASTKSGTKSVQIKKWTRMEEHGNVTANSPPKSLTIMRKGTTAAFGDKSSSAHRATMSASADAIVTRRPSSQGIRVRKASHALFNVPDNNSGSSHRHHNKGGSISGLHSPDKCHDLDRVPPHLVPLAVQPQPRRQEKTSSCGSSTKTTTGLPGRLACRSNDSLDSRLRHLFAGYKITATAAGVDDDQQLPPPASTSSSQSDLPSQRVAVPLSTLRKNSGSLHSTVGQSKCRRPSNPKSLHAADCLNKAEQHLSARESRERKLSTHSVRETRAIDYRARRPSSTLVATSAPTLPSAAPNPTEAASDVHMHAVINQYEVIKEIGEGTFAKVLLVLDTQENRYYACKAISKKKLRKKSIWRNGPQRKKKPTGASTASSTVTATADTCTNMTVNDNVINSNNTAAAVPPPTFDYMQMVRREIAILKRLSCHPRVSTLIEVLDDATHDTLYMIFELYEYGSIMKIRTDKRVEPFSEALACRYFRDIVLGLEYLHYMEIIHCDIKPENILLNTRNHAVIGDFSISVSDKIELDEQNSHSFGNGLLTPVFTPPESITLQQDGATAPKPVQFNAASDIWALGVTLFCFVHGYLPFHTAGSSLEQLYNDIVALPVSQQINPDLSADLRDLLEQLLHKDPTRRITVSAIRRHPWVTAAGPLPTSEENCVAMVGTTDMFSTMSDEELTSAIKPAVTLVERIKSRLKERRDRASIPFLPPRL